MSKASRIYAMLAVPGNVIIVLPEEAVLCSHYVMDLTFDPRTKPRVVHWIW